VRKISGMEEVFIILTATIRAWGSIHDYDSNEHDELMTFKILLDMSHTSRMHI
jgi:hypothetical protein